MSKFAVHLIRVKPGHKWISLHEDMNDLAPNVWLHSTVHHRTDIAEVMGSNPIEALIFFFQASSFQLLKLENLLR